MMQKLQKLIKILNRFTVDDLVSMSDFEEKEIKKALEIFEKENKISKISQTEYIYVKIPLQKF